MEFIKVKFLFDRRLRLGICVIKRLWVWRNGRKLGLAVFSLFRKDFLQISRWRYCVRTQPHEVVQVVAFLLTLLLLNLLDIAHVFDINILDESLNSVVLAKDVRNDFEDLNLANDYRWYVRHPLVVKSEVLLVLLDLVHDIVNQLDGICIFIQALCGASCGLENVGQVLLVIHDEVQDVNWVMHDHDVHRLRGLLLVLSKNGFFQIYRPVVVVNLLQNQRVLYLSHSLEDSIFEKLATFELSFHFLQVL